MNELRELYEALRGWLEILFPLAILLFFVLFRYASQYLKAKRLREIAPILNGQLVLRPFLPPRIQGTYMGMDFQISFLSEARNTPGRLLVKLGFPCPFTMEIHPKGRMQGLTDLLTASRSYETGEEDLDSHVVIKVDKAKESAEVYLKNPMNRQAILTAFQEGIVSVSYSSDGVTLTRLGNFLTGEFSAEMALLNLSLAGRLVQRF